MNTKQLLNEWKNYLNSLNNPKLLNEISFEALNAQFPSFDFSSIEQRIEEDNDITSKNLFKKFKKDTVYLDIVANTLKTQRSHSPDEFFDQFDVYLKNVITTKERWPKKFDDLFIYKGQNIVGSTATYEDIQQYLDLRASEGKGSTENLITSLQKVLDDRNILNYEIVHEDSNWIICYINTRIASLAIARAYWNGSKLQYDNTFDSSTGIGQKIGEMKWCTAVSGNGNMFNRYHDKKNLHMYYCINKINQDINDPERKMCISFNKQNNKVSLSTNQSATVDAYNTVIDENEIASILGDTILEKIYNDVRQDKRREQSEQEYFENVTLEKFIELRDENINNLEAFSNFEVSKTLAYSKEKEKIIDYILKNEKNKDVINNIMSELRVTFDLFLSIKSRMKAKDFEFIISGLLNKSVEKEKIIDYILENETNEYFICTAISYKEFTFEEFLKYDLQFLLKNNLLYSVIKNSPERQEICKYLYENSNDNKVKYVALAEIILSFDEFFKVYEELKKSDMELLTKTISLILNNSPDEEEILLYLLRNKYLSLDFIFEGHIFTNRRVSLEFIEILCSEFKKLITTQYSTPTRYYAKTTILFDILYRNKPRIRKHVMEKFSNDEEITNQVILSLDNDTIDESDPIENFLFYINRLNDKQLSDNEIAGTLAIYIHNQDNDIKNEIIQYILDNTDNIYLKYIGISAYCFSKVNLSFDEIKKIHERFGNIILNVNAAHNLAWSTNSKETYYYLLDNINDTDENKKYFHSYLLHCANGLLRGYIVKLTFEDLMYFGSKYNFDGFAKDLYFDLTENSRKVFDKKTKKLIAKFILDNESIFEQKDEREKRMYNVINAAKKYLGIEQQELNVESLLKTYIKLIIS